MRTEHSTEAQLAFWVVVIGAITWGPVATVSSLVDAIPRDFVWVERAIYAVIGLSGLYLALRFVPDRLGAAVTSRA